MHEHPSVSQSFVVNEAAAVRVEGVPTFGYALRPGEATRPAAEIDLIAPPPSDLRLGMAALSALSAIPSVARRARRLKARELARLMLAEAHASYAVGRARGVGIDHVHAHFLGRTADVAAALARRLGCRWSATAHGDDVYAPAEPGLLKMHLNEVAAVACASRDVREHLAGHATAAGTDVASDVIRCGIDASALQFAPAEPAVPHVVTIGRLVETKGYLTAMEAMKDVMVRDHALLWTIVGEGPLRPTLEKAVADAGLGERITLAGALDHPQALARLAEASLFVLPCQRGPAGDSDGIPVVLMEAMALGVPVVTAPVGGIRELVEPEQTGYLVPPKDPRALAATLRRILDAGRRDQLERVRVAARGKIEREFDQVGEARALIGLLGSHTDG